MHAPAWGCSAYCAAGLHSLYNRRLLAQSAFGALWTQGIWVLGMCSRSSPSQSSVVRQIKGARSRRHRDSAVLVAFRLGILLRCMLQHRAAARIVPRGCTRYTTGGSLPRVPLVRYGLRVSGSLVCVAAPAHPKVALPSTDKSKLQSLALTRDRSSQIKFLWPWPDQAPCLLVVSCAEDDGAHVSEFPVHLGPVQASPGQK